MAGVESQRGGAARQWEVPPGGLQPPRTPEAGRHANGSFHVKRRAEKPGLTQREFDEFISRLPTAADLGVILRPVRDGSPRQPRGEARGRSGGPSDGASASGLAEGAPVGPPAAPEACPPASPRMAGVPDGAGAAGTVGAGGMVGAAVSARTAEVAPVSAQAVPAAASVVSPAAPAGAPTSARPPAKAKRSLDLESFIQGPLSRLDPLQAGGRPRGRSITQPPRRQGTERRASLTPGQRPRLSGAFALESSQGAGDHGGGSFDTRLPPLADIYERSSESEEEAEMRERHERHEKSEQSTSLEKSEKPADQLDYDVSVVSEGSSSRRSEEGDPAAQELSREFFPGSSQDLPHSRTAPAGLLRGPYEAGQLDSRLSLPTQSPGPLLQPLANVSSSTAAGSRRNRGMACIAPLRIRPVEKNSSGTADQRAKTRLIPSAASSTDESSARSGPPDVPRLELDALAGSTHGKSPSLSARPAAATRRPARGVSGGAASCGTPRVKLELGNPVDTLVRSKITEKGVVNNSVVVEDGDSDFRIRYLVNPTPLFIGNTCDIYTVAGSEKSSVAFSARNSLSLSSGLGVNSARDGVSDEPTGALDVPEAPDTPTWSARAPRSLRIDCVAGNQPVSHHPPGDASVVQQNPGSPPNPADAALRSASDATGMADAVQGVSDAHTTHVCLSISSRRTTAKSSSETSTQAPVGGNSSEPGASRGPRAANGGADCSAASKAAAMHNGVAGVPDLSGAAGHVAAHSVAGTAPPPDPPRAAPASSAAPAAPNPAPAAVVGAHKAMGGDVIACQLVEALSDIAEGKKSYLPSPFVEGRGKAGVVPRQGESLSQHGFPGQPAPGAACRHRLGAALAVEALTEDGAS